MTAKGHLFGHDVRKCRLVNTIMGQMTEMSQRTKDLELYHRMKDFHL